jgi:hypothetical protein
MPLVPYFQTLGAPFPGQHISRVAGAMIEAHFLDSIPARPVSSSKGHLSDFTGVTTREEHMGNLQH